MSTISQLNAQERLRATRAVAAMRTQAAATTPAPSTSVRQPDAVNLSAEARSMSAARKATAGAGEVREDRIAALKAAVANGTYAVPARDLARSMMRASDIGQ